jgi:hypothetical protein
MGFLPTITMKARYYQKGPDRFQVYLSWKGKKYWRSHYDHRVNLVNATLAQRLADAINQDIDLKGPGFDPRQWFEVKGFAFKSYADQWLKDHYHSYAPSVKRNIAARVESFQRFFGEKAPDGKPCNWTLGGLFRTHTLEVVTPDGKKHPRFEVATPEQAQAHLDQRRF